MKGRKHTIKAKVKIGLASLGRPSPFKGKRRSAEFCAMRRIVALKVWADRKAA